MSQTCVFFDADGHVTVQESLSSRNLFTFLKQSMAKPTLIYAYMGWTVFGSAPDSVADAQLEKNNAATTALAKIFKSGVEKTLQGSIAFCFRSPTCKSLQLIRDK